MKPVYFEIATLVLNLFIVILIVARYKHQRDYWYAVIGLGLCFPFEWWADWSYWYLLYDRGFFMMFDRLPLMMPFAFVGFYAFPLIATLRFQNKIDAMPLWKRFLALYLIFLAWDFIVEYPSTFTGLYAYHWPREWLMRGGLPWPTPFLVSFTNVMTYFTHKAALRYSHGKKWFQGLLTHIGAYTIMFTLFEEFLFYTILHFIMRIQPRASYFLH